MKRKIRYFLTRVVIVLKYYAMSFYANLINSGKYEKKVLVIRPDAIGDFIIFSKYLWSYKELYPEYKMDILINEINYELAKDAQFITGIIKFNRTEMNRNWLYKFNILNQIRNKRYEIVIYPIYSREELGEEISIFSGAKERITFDGDYCNISPQIRKMTDRLYTKVLPCEKVLKHEDLRNREFLRTLGCTWQVFNTFINIPKEFSKMLSKQNQEFLKYPYFVLLPGCGSFIRFWGVEKYAQLINQINLDYNIILCGSKEELELIDEIIDKISPQKKKKILNLAGKTSLHDLIYLISKAKFYLGSETSAVHIAELCNVPSLCIVGGGHFNRFYPYEDSKNNYAITHKLNCFYCDWQCIHDSIKCIKEVSVNDVMNVIKKVGGENG